jgi:hypothetical protein
MDRDQDARGAKKESGHDNLTSRESPNLEASETIARPDVDVVERLDLSSLTTVR